MLCRQAIDESKRRGSKLAPSYCVQLFRVAPTESAKSTHSGKQCRKPVEQPGLPRPHITVSKKVGEPIIARPGLGMTAMAQVTGNRFFAKGVAYNPRNEWLGLQLRQSEHLSWALGFRVLIAKQEVSAHYQEQFLQYILVGRAMVGWLRMRHSTAFCQGFEQLQASIACDRPV